MTRQLGAIILAIRFLEASQGWGGPPPSLPMTEPVIASSPGGVESLSQGSIQQKSYAAVVNKRPIMKRFEHVVSTIDGVPTIEIPNEVITESVPLWEDFLVGRFPETAPHIAKIHVIVN